VGKGGGGGWGFSTGWVDLHVIAEKVKIYSYHHAPCSEKSLFTG